MPESPVFVVILRRPWSKKTRPDEKRSDPFWEFGSFGITCCHIRNLMNPKYAERLDGARLAFAQGGRHGTRLVHLTPPIRVATHMNRIEATWTPCKMPFRYLLAPILAQNPKVSDFPMLKRTLEGGNRNTIEGQFASQFRSRTTPLEASIAKEIIQVYSSKRKRTPSASIAACYTDALPKLPPLVDHYRQRTYLSLLEDANTNSPQSELAIGYSANARRNRALSNELARIGATVACGQTCTPRRKSSRC
jgi:hypothetical protein